MTLPAGRAVAVVGFMGAGKTTVGRLLAAQLGRPFVDADDVIVERAGLPVPEIFAREGEAGFRRREAEVATSLLARPDAPVVALGGGAVTTASVRDALRAHATTIWLDVDVDVALTRVGGVSAHERPLAADVDGFRARHAARLGVYAGVADRVVDADASAEAVAEACLRAAWTRPGALAALPGLVGDRRSALVVDRAVADRVPGEHAVRIVVEGGEDAKSPAALERLWRALAGADLERRDVIVAVGGGTVTDVGGFAAATLRRGLAWIAVPTTLVGQVDAAIGGKTAINVAAKNDVGAFHLPEDVIADPAVLETLPPREWACGFAEALKTGLLRGGRLHELCCAWPEGPGDAADRAELVQRCAAVKTAVIVDDPTERGRRAILNLGHTIGHGVEAAAGYGGLLHGECVAIGLVQALALSEELRGLDPGVRRDVEATLARQGLPTVAAGIDPDAVWDAMRGDKKRVGGRQRLVLLDAVGAPVWGVEVADDVLRAAVERACGA